MSNLEKIENAVVEGYKKIENGVTIIVYAWKTVLSKIELFDKDFGKIVYKT